jgi:hypothetical protein
MSPWLCFVAGTLPNWGEKLGRNVVGFGWMKTNAIRVVLVVAVMETTLAWTPQIRA